MIPVMEVEPAGRHRLRMNVQQFRAKWRGATLKERSAAQEYFFDLCRLFGVPTPAEADPSGESYALPRRGA
jgi:hypothetical protein